MTGKRIFLVAASALWLAAPMGRAATDETTGQAAPAFADADAAMALMQALGRPDLPQSLPEALADRCCKRCSKGKACGDSCIAADRRCSKGAGCACDD